MNTSGTRGNKTRTARGSLSQLVPPRYFTGEEAEADWHQRKVQGPQMSKLALTLWLCTSAQSLLFHATMWHLVYPT